MAVRTYTETINALYTTTLNLRLPKLQDQFFEARPFFYIMTKRGRMRKGQQGGRFIEEPLRYGQNETVTFVGKGESVALQDTDVLTTSLWEWKYPTGHILRYHADWQKNKGKSQIINKVNSDIDTLFESLRNMIADEAFSDGTNYNGKTIIGLAKIVAEAPTTGTVGQLNRATYDWWRPQYKDASAKDVSVHLVPYMLTMYNDCGQWGEGGSRFPNLVVTDQSTHEYYERECLEIAQIKMADDRMAGLGFGSLSYKGAPMVWDPKCTNNSMYFLNTDVLTFWVDPTEWMKLGEWQDIYNQPEDYIAHALMTCALTCGNCRKQGVIFDIGEAT